MAKSQTQRSREHVARLRRKAQAFDNLIVKVEMVSGWIDHTDKFLASQILKTALAEAKEAVEDAGAQ